jgi:DNA-binding transcriptional LysR family regulator
MNTRDLEAFLAVVETGSIVAASTRLHLTQPGVSRRIQSLESLLGVALLDRQSKPLRPTAAGRETYEHGRRMLRVLEDLRTRLSPDGAVAGELRLGITPYLSELAVAAPLDALRTAFPQLAVCVTTGWPEQLAERLRRGEIDVATFCLPDDVAPPGDVEARAVGVQSLSVIAPHDVALPSKVTLQALSALPWIINQDGCGFRSVLQRRMAQERLPFQIGIEALSSDLRLSLVARGLGVTMTSRDAFESSPLRAQLKRLVVQDFQPRVQAWVVHRAPAGRLASPFACFGDALAAAFDTDGRRAGAGRKRPRA